MTSKKRLTVLICLTLVAVLLATAILLRQTGDRNQPPFSQDKPITYLPLLLNSSSPKPVSFPQSTFRRNYVLPFDPDDWLPISANNHMAPYEIARLGKGWPTASTFSSDGSRLALATVLGVYFYESDTWEQTGFFPSASPILSLAYSPDDKWLAFGSQDGILTILPAHSLTVAQTLVVSTSPIRSLAFSRPERGTGESTMLAFGTEGGRVAVRHLASQTVLFSFSDPLLGYWGYGIRSLAFSANNEILAGGGDMGYVSLWKLTTGELLPKLQTQNGLLFSLSFSPDGTYLASACSDGTVQIWNFQNHSPMHLLEGHAYGAWSVAYSPDGQILAVGAGDGTVHFWNPLGGMEISPPYSSLKGSADSISFSPTGEWISAISFARQAHIIQIGSLSAGILFPLHGEAVQSVDISPDGTDLLAMTLTGSLVRWNFIRGEVTHVDDLLPSADTVRDAFFLPHDRIAVIDGARDVIRMLSANTYLPRIEYSARGMGKAAISLERDLIGVAGSEIFLLDVQHDRFQRLLLPTRATSLAILSSRQTGQRSLAAGLLTGKILLWDLSTGQSEEVTSYTREPIWALASHDVLLAAGNNRGGIVLWDMQTRKFIRTFSGHSAAVLCLTFSPSGDILASSGMDSKIILWDTRSGKQLSVLTGHQGWVNDLVFSPHGKLLISSGSDGTLRVWGISQNKNGEGT